MEKINVACDSFPLVYVFNALVLYASLLEIT